MKTSFTPVVAAIIASLFLSACASTSYPAPYGAQPYPATTAYPYPSSNTYPYRASYGVVESIQLGQPAATQGSGAGVILGGVVGGLLGHQVGKGSGRTAATVAGAVGGAIAGNEIEKRNGAQRNQYLISVRMDNGGYQTLAQDYLGDLQVGSRVRIDNNTVYRY
ncbi:outer membrane lipoprotein SlyB [Paucimonas lemoignei]|uniref:Outer membrane lipoprotein SlyB n=1 Tax=Paucimonas lemoignei TaxID=29443 RepID=A0A4R3I0P6_PAULE|nr:glycine zipper 2TM domain-containing protein [Paucimonas lemoignei]TCS38553.1 outer membrane lipoprotein SlyB [Paucimonas lemoignei]